eukprot:TRINITY_DN3229_c0_g2_i1.p1 TRINITY_DN3229_c0_g2~~TRINITY_DN3229_c0_g2_i1.p1  ORF type:complete len:417 (-),score=114.06 TRINITY_DN3229_c0_g2_i1:1094-2218(-)
MAVKRLFVSLQENIERQPLAQVAAWAIGEFGDLLITSSGSASPKESEVVDLLQTLIQHSQTSLRTRQIAASAVMKLAARYPAQSARLLQLLEPFKTHLSLELQQRAVEYSNLYNKHADIAALFERMPAPQAPEESESPPLTTVAPAAPQQSAPSKTTTSAAAVAEPVKQPTLIDDILSTPVVDAAPAKSSGQALLDDLLAGSFAPLVPQKATPPVPVPAPVQPAQPMQPVQFMHPVQPMQPVQPVLVATPAFTAPANSIVAWSKHGATIYFRFERVPTHPTVTTVHATFVNTSSQPITNFNVQGAVPKHVKLQLNAPSATTLPANAAGVVTQVIRLANSAQGEKKLAIRLKIDFEVSGKAVSEVAQFNDFPEGS